MYTLNLGEENLSKRAGTVTLYYSLIQLRVFRWAKRSDQNESTPYWPAVSRVVTLYSTLTTVIRSPFTQRLGTAIEVQAIQSRSLVHCAPVLSIFTHRRKILALFICCWNGLYDLRITFFSVSTSGHMWRQTCSASSEPECVLRWTTPNDCRGPVLLSSGQRGNISVLWSLN